MIANLAEIKCEYQTKKYNFVKNVNLTPLH